MTTRELQPEEPTSVEQSPPELSAEAETSTAIPGAPTQVRDSDSNDDSDSSDSSDNIADSDVQRYVEAMIFSSASPLPSAKISQALNLGGVSRIKRAIAALNESYESAGRAFRIRQVAGGYQYYVLPQWSECLKKLFTKTRRIRLTKAALETMAVVAYKQPVSKNQVEFIRGVASDGVLHNLLEKNLIKISGRAEGAGRSLLYSATDEFLRFFGLNSFDDLPRIAEIEELIQQMEVDRAENDAEAPEALSEPEQEMSEPDGSACNDALEPTTETVATETVDAEIVRESVSPSQG